MLKEQEYDSLREKYLGSIAKIMEEALTPRQYQITHLYFIQNLNICKISDKLNINKSTVSRTIRRSLEKLKPYLKWGVEKQKL